MSTVTKAQASNQNAQSITVSFNFGEANHVADEYFNHTDTLHNLFTDELLKTPKACFALCPLKDGIRDNANALPTSILALDFDSPLAKLDSVREFFSDCNHVVYTTKSHQKDKKGVVCDRFRIVLELDKPLNPSDLPGIVDWFVDNYHADPACKDGARFFYTGVETTLVIRNPAFPLSTDWLLSLAPVQGAPEATLPLPGPLPLSSHGTSTAIVLSTKPAHSAHVAFLRKAWTNVQGKSENTFEDVFQLMLLWIQQFGNDLSALKAALLKVEDVEDFYNRNNHQWTGVDATLTKALRYVIGNKDNGLTHKNKVKEIDPDTIPFDFVQNDACHARGLVEFIIDDTDKLIGNVFENEKKAIIDIQCGVGKTLVGSSFVAISTDKWIIVKDTVKACESQRDLLIQYGVDRAQIQVLQSWSKARCKEGLDKLFKIYTKKASQAKMRREFADRAYAELENGWGCFCDKTKNSPCEKCWSGCEYRKCRTHSRIKMTFKSKRIVVMTHARFMELVHWASKDISDFRILIDEELNSFETVSFGSKEIELILGTFDKSLGGKVTDHINGILEDPKLGSISDCVEYDHAELKTLQNKASLLDPEQKEIVYKYLHFMGYHARRFAFVEKDNYGKKITLIRNRLNFSLQNDIYILNASSRFGLATWDGFNVIRSTRQFQASGVTVYGYDSNHTMNRFNKEARSFLEYALGLIKKNGRKKILLATNKEESQKSEVKEALKWFKLECLKSGVEVSTAERGSIIGRNDWRFCDCVVMAYGVFTSVANVVLKQSLVEGGEIESSRIWDIKENGDKQPRIKKGMVDKELRETDRRLFADDVYQVGLRGQARNWKGDSQDVICLAPSMDYLFPIAQVLPSCRIVFGDKDFSETKTEDLLQNDTELCKLHGLPKNAENLVKVRTMSQDMLNQRWQVGT